LLNISLSLTGDYLNNLQLTFLLPGEDAREEKSYKRQGDHGSLVLCLFLIRTEQETEIGSPHPPRSHLINLLHKSQLIKKCYRLKLIHIVMKEGILVSSLLAGVLTLILFTDGKTLLSLLFPLFYLILI
jgi:hypothetical protein